MSDHLNQSGRFAGNRSARIVVTTVAVLLVVLAFSGVADRWGAARVEDGLQRSLVAFGVARTLNGIISVAQHTEVAFQPAGVGVSLAPGQILDPLNDLVERFSWVMLVASTSFGVQRLLMEVFSSTTISLLMVLLAGLLIASIWRTDTGLKRYRGWLLRVGLLVAMVRFLVPALAITGEMVHETFMQPRYEAAVTGLDDTADRLGELTLGEAPGDPEDASLASRIRSWYEEAGALLDVQARLDEYQALAASAAEQTIELIAVFTFQTAVLPLLFLWLMVVVYRSLVHFRPLGRTAG